MLCLIFLATTAVADPQSCPVSYTYYEGDEVSLTATPSGTEYTYEWNPDPAITRKAGTDPWVFTFIVPDYDPASPSYAVELYLYPTGAPEACKDRCEITVNVMQRASLGDFVWHDINGDGIQDSSGEPGVGNVKVELINSTTALVADTKLTNPDGSYLFTNILPGDYYVRFYLPDGYQFSPQNAGGDDAKDSDPDSAGNTATISLASGESDLTVDAGLYQPVGIIVIKSTQPAGDSQLFDFTPSHGPAFQLSDTQSHSSGPLSPGTYSVSETAAAGWDLTDVECSDGSPADAIVLSSGETVTVKFTNTKRGSITVTKEAVGGDD
ncbi:MAG TPA: SdrD B-like domain-containing protein, partial [Methanothrix sp.]|nr:SdrD B-like domain-containing protein [Methanothrix sp.]